MKNIKIVLALIGFFSVVSCQKQTEHQFIYAFENKEEVTIENINKTIKVLEDRLSSYGLKFVIEPFQNKSIKINAYANRLKVESFNRVVVNKGKLEFWETCNANNFRTKLFDIKDMLSKDSDKEKYNTSTSILENAVSGDFLNGSILLYFKPSDTLDVVKKLDSLKLKLSGKERFVKFLYGLPREDKTLPIHVIQSNRENRAAISGSVVTKVRQSFNQINQPVVSLFMNKEGALQWERLTEKAYNENSQIAMVINDIVFSAPGVANGPIKEGRSEISGNFNVIEAVELSAILSGKEEIPQLKLLKYTKQPQ